MSEKTDAFERYRREMMEMYRKASPARKTEIQDEDITEDSPQECVREEREDTMECEPETPCDEDSPEGTEEKKQNDLPSFCSLCDNRIALCEFSVVCAGSGTPIENAQIVLHSDNGFFIRVLTDSSGKTCEIPIFEDREWRIGVTAQGYISVSRAKINPAAGEKITVPVRLDESLQLNDIFTEHKSSLFGA